MIFNVVRFAIESLNYSTQIIFLIVIILTGGYYVEHTRLLLPTNQITSEAENGSIFQL